MSNVPNTIDCTVWCCEPQSCRYKQALAMSFLPLPHMDMYGTCLHVRQIRSCMLQIGVPDGGRYEAVLSSDSPQFGGSSRIGTGVEHFSQPEGIPGSLPIQYLLDVTSQQSCDCCCICHKIDNVLCSHHPYTYDSGCTDNNIIFYPIQTFF